MNNKDRFESWFNNHHTFRGKRVTSIRDYLSYHKTIAKLLNIQLETFYGTKSIARLKAMELQLKDNPQFQSKTNKSDLISGLHTYIKFRNWTPPPRIKPTKAKPKSEAIIKSPLRIKKEKIAEVSPTLLTLKKIDKKREGFLKIELLAFNFDGSGNALIRGYDEKGKSSLLPLDKSMLNEVLWGYDKSPSNYTTE